MIHNAMANSLFRKQRKMIILRKLHETYRQPRSSNAQHYVTNKALVSLSLSVEQKPQPGGIET